MKSISSIVLASALYGVATVSAGAMTPEGCYSSTAGLTLNTTFQFNSIGKCGGACLAGNFVTFATHQYDCYCGQELPPASTSIENSTCSFTCPGYPPDLCGGASAFSLYLTGLSTGVSNTSPSEITTSATPDTASSTTSAKPSVVTIGGETVIVTASAQATISPSSSPSSGPSKAGIAAGIVVGLIALCALGGGAFLLIRHKQRREIEEEHRRQAAVNNFIGGGKAPSSSGGYSFTDTRLDPAVMAQRRLSDGSIADNQDYSRRILKVTNA